MKKIFIYGVGENFFEYESFIRERYEIVGFLDCDNSKQGLFLYGLEILNPTKASELECDYILITPNSFEEIKKFLIESGIDENKILILHKELVSNDIDDDVLKITFSIGAGSGLGDILIALNYVYCWTRKYKNDKCRITVVFDRYSELVNGFGNTEECLDDIVISDEHKAGIDNSDLYILIRRYPRVLKSIDRKVAILAPDIIDYLLLVKRFSIFHPDLLGIELLSDGKSVDYEKSVGHKRINQSDLYDNLVMGEEFSIIPSIDPSLLSKFGLRNQLFITVHRGCDRKLFEQDNVKLWNEECYEQVISSIKESFPDLKIVLVGDEYERSNLIVSQDFDLLGKTDFEDLKCLLKNSLVHIDTEGGLVHLRHAVKGGPSVVIFGPTDPEFFGYAENINIRTDACPVPCEWKTLDWVANCSNKDKKCCMSSITPEMIHEKVISILDKVYRSI